MSLKLVPHLRRSFTCQLTDGASTAATGTLSSYTVPTNKTGVCTFASIAITGTVPTIQLQVVRGATVAVVRTDSADYTYSPNIGLQGGDIIRLQITGAGAGSTTDSVLSVEIHG